MNSGPGFDPYLLEGSKISFHISEKLLAGDVVIALECQTSLSYLGSRPTPGRRTGLPVSRLRNRVRSGHMRKTM